VPLPGPHGRSVSETGPDSAATPAARDSALGQLGRSGVIYGLGMIVPKAISFGMLPVYTRFLTPSDYGVMELIEMTLDVIAIVAGARLAIGIFRYYEKAETDAERRAVVSTALQVLAFTYGIVGGATFLAAPFLSDLVFGTPEHTLLIRLAAASLAFSSLELAPLSYLRIRDRAALYVGAEIGKVALQVGLNILFLAHFGLGVTSIFLSGLIANVVVGAALASYAVREVGFHFSRPVTRDLIRYGAPLVVTQVATFLLTFGDRYFLRVAADTHAVGLYALAYQFGFLLMEAGYAPYSKGWEPLRFAISSRADRDDVYARSFVYLNLLLLSVATFLALFIDDVLILMTTPPFYPAARFVPLILLAYVFQSWTFAQDLGIHMRERTEFLTLANWIAAIAALLGYWIFVPRYLAMGAAGVTAAAFALRYALVYWISQTIWPVRYRWGPVLRIAGLGLAVLAISRALPDVHVFASIALKGAIFLLYALGIWMLGVLSREERDQVRVAVRRWRGAIAVRFGRASGAEGR